jgi:hypothetical protein
VAEGIKKEPSVREGECRNEISFAYLQTALWLEEQEEEGEQKRTYAVFTPRA